MTIGIILAVIFLLLVFNLGVIKIKNDQVKKWLRRIHQWLGVLFLGVAMIHMILAWKLVKQRPVSMYILGVVMVVAAALAVFSFLFRKKLKKKWLPIHRIASIMILICLVFHIFFGLSSFSEYKSMVANIHVSDVNLEDVKDGTYIGECNVGYIYAKVKVDVENGQILYVTLLDHRTERGKPAEVIVNQMVKEQSVKVDAVSSATNFSKVIMKAVENALKEK